MPTQEKKKLSCTSCQAIINKICTNLNKEQYREIKKQEFLYNMFTLSNTFHFLNNQILIFPR